MNNIKNVAIIMDGNGRWAKLRGLPRTAGHLQGTKNIRNITIAANNMGLSSLTLFAFSTENWKRDEKEVEYIMRLPGKFFEDYIDELMENNVKISLVGERDRLPSYALSPIEEAEKRTKDNTGLLLNLCLNYGGQREIVLAVKDIVKEGIPAEEITEDTISSHLMGASADPLDLLIRTSGEYRISNFLLWQLAYSELYFTDVLWPDFDEKCFVAAIESFNGRDRRFGGVKK